MTPQGAASDPLLELLASRCCLHVLGPKPGAGFFVAEDLVLTCAHVVGDLQEIDLLRDGATLSGRVIARLPHDDDDLALIQLADAVGTPVLLGEEAWPGDELYAFGYPGEAAAIDGFSAIYEARTSTDARRPDRPRHFHHKFKNGHVVPGYSGGPLINMKTHCVVGVVSHTRSRETDIGGWAIPIQLAVTALSPPLRPQQPDDAALATWHQAVQDRALALAERTARLRRDLAGGSEQMPFMTAIENFVASYLGTAENPEPFGGRQNELSALEAWRTDPGAPPYLMLTAPAGRGKSSLLVHWMQQLLTGSTPEHLIQVVFVPISIRYGLNDEASVLRSLAARLCAVYRETLPLATQALTARWREIIGALLSRAPPDNRQLIVILDGADEAAGWEMGPALFPVKPAQGIKLVVSAREQATRTAHQWLEQMQWARLTLSRLMVIPPLDASGVSDVLLRMGAPLDQLSEQDALIRQLMRLSEGDPLLLSLYVKDLWQQQRSTAGLQSLDLPQMAPGLAGYFDRWWQDQVKLAAGRLFVLELTRHLFNVLAAAFAPLPRRELLALLRKIQPDIAGDALDAAAQPLSRFLLSDADNSFYVFAHPRFSIYRFTKLQRDGEHARYENLFLSHGDEVQAQVAAGGSSPSDAHYIVRFRLAHLLRSGRPVAQLRPLLEPAWRQAWELLPEIFGGYVAVVAEVWNRLAVEDRRVVRQGKPPPFLADQLACALEIASHAQYSRALTPELVASLVRFGKWRATTALQYARSRERPTDTLKVLEHCVRYLAGADLADAEQQIMALRNEDEEYFAEAVAALCARLCETANVARAVTLANAMTVGYPQAHVLLAIAGVTVEQDARARFVLDAAGELQEAGWRLLAYLVEQLGTVFDLAKTARATNLPALPTAVREAWANIIEQRIADSIRKPVSPIALSEDVNCQYLEYLIPVLSPSQRIDYLQAFLAALAKPTRLRMAVDALEEIAPFIPASFAGLAKLSAAQQRNPEEVACSLLAIWELLGDTDRAMLRAQVLAAIPLMAEANSSDTLSRCFRLVARAGFGSEIVAYLGSLNDPRWGLSYLLTAAAPHLSLPDTQQALQVLSRFPTEQRIEFSAPLLSRLAQFDAASAELALQVASQSDPIDHLHLPRLFLNAAISLQRPTDDDSRADLIRSLAQLPDPDLRNSALRVAATTLRPLPAIAVTEAVSSFGIDYRAADSFAALAPAIAPSELADEALLSCCAHVAWRIPSEDKCEQLATYFLCLIQSHQAAVAQQLALYLSRDGFDPPLVALCFAIGDSGNRELADAVHPHLDRISNEWEQAAALAALARTGALIDIQAICATLQAQLSEIEVRARARSMAHLLRQLPPPDRQRVFAAITPHCADFACADHSTELGAFRWLAEAADITHLGEWIKKVSQASSSTRSEPLAAIATRFATLGCHDEAIRTARLIPTRSVQAAALASIIPTLPGATLLDLHTWIYAYGFAPAQRLRIWSGIVLRLPTLSSDEVLSLVETAFRALSREATADLLNDLLGACAAIAALGGVAGLDAAVETLRHASQAARPSA